MSIEVKQDTSQHDLFEQEPQDKLKIGLQQKQIFQLPQDASVISQGRGRNSETNIRISQLLRALRGTGLTRPYAQPDVMWRAMLDKLEHEMANFAPVIQTVIRPHLHLVSMGIDHRMPPILLLGEPGVGKTRFANQLAKILGLPKPLHIQMAAETNGASLAGSSTFWSNSAPGLLFEALAWGTGTGMVAANPLVLLDELDKPSKDMSYDPIGSLYTLLEADTAVDFQDQSLPDVQIDTSSVRWIGTANDISCIPEPVRSRMCTFEIQMPTAEQQQVIMQGMYQSLLAKYHLPLTDELPPSVLDRLASLSPREAKIALDCAIASAVARCSLEIAVKDLGVFGTKSKASLRNRIGFR